MFNENWEILNFQFQIQRQAFMGSIQIPWKRTSYIAGELARSYINAILFLVVSVYYKYILTYMCILEYIQEYYTSVGHFFLRSQPIINHNISVLLTKVFNGCHEWGKWHLSSQKSPIDFIFKWTDPNRIRKLIRNPIFIRLLCVPESCSKLNLSGLRWTVYIQVCVCMHNIIISLYVSSFVASPVCGICLLFVIYS